MIISKLAWKSVRSQYYHYAVYLIGMIFAVTIYYSFRAIAYDQILLNSVGSEIRLKNTMEWGGFLIIIMIISFMLTVNQFFFSRRVKEIGIYQLIGMRKRQIAGVFFSEISILGITALVIGLLLGVIFSKLFSMILIKVMFLTIESSIRLSFPAMLETISAFIFILLLISIHSWFLLYSYQLTSFFKRDEKAAVTIEQLTKKQLFLGCVGVGLILAGYILSFHVLSLAADDFNPVILLSLPFLLIALCSAGTYLFFKYTIHILIWLFSRGKQRYYRGLTMLVAGSTRLHLFKGSNTLTTITIFIACSLGIIGGSASFYTLGIEGVTRTNPTDFLVSSELYGTIQKNIEQKTSITQSVPLKFKVIGGQYRQTIKNQETTTLTEPINLLGVSNYREYQKINPYLKPIVLKKKDSAVMIDDMQNGFRELITYDPVVKLTDGLMLETEGSVPDYLGNAMLRYNQRTMIVSDELFNQVKTAAAYELTAFNIKKNNDSQLTDAALKGINKEWQGPIYYELNNDAGSVKGYVSTVSKKNSEDSEEHEVWRLNYTSRLPNLEHTRKELGIFLYIILFAGILALVISGSVLMVRQFSEAEREKTTYQLLERLGISRRQIQRLVYQQNIIIFFLPMLLGIFHAFFAVRLFNQVVPSSGYQLAYLSCGLLILIYVIYYMITAKIYYWIVSKGD
ncbi:ABC transporter permease [Enterococcus sp. LJL128]